MNEEERRRKHDAEVGALECAARKTIETPGQADYDSGYRAGFEAGVSHRKEIISKSEMKRVATLDPMRAADELARLQKRIEELEAGVEARGKMDRFFFEEIIFKWKHHWRENEPGYEERAFGIDANMKVDLARRLARAVQDIPNLDKSGSGS